MPVVIIEGVNDVIRKWGWILWIIPEYSEFIIHRIVLIDPCSGDCKKQLWRVIIFFNESARGAILRKHIIRGLYRGSNNTFWVGTYGNGLSVFNTRTSEFTAHYHHDPSNAKSLSSDYVTDVYTDRSGILWIGTDAGLDKFDPFTQQFQSIPIPEAEGEFSVYRTPGTFVEKYDDPSNLLMPLLVASQ